MSHSTFHLSFHAHARTQIPESMRAAFTLLAFLAVSAIFFHGVCGWGDPAWVRPVGYVPERMRIYRRKHWPPARELREEYAKNSSNMICNLYFAQRSMFNPPETLRKFKKYNFNNTNTSKKLVKK